MASIVNEQGGDTSQQMSSGEALYRAIMKNNGVTLSYKEGCSSTVYAQGDYLNNVIGNSASGGIYILPQASCTNGNRSVSSVTLSYRVRVTSSISSAVYSSSQQGNISISALGYDGGSESLSIASQATMDNQGTKVNGDVTKTGTITISNPSSTILTLNGVNSHVQTNGSPRNTQPTISITGSILATIEVTSMTLSDGTVVTP